MAHVETVFLARENSAPMEEVDSVDAVDGGLSGDRYQTGRGYYSPYDVCEVTLIEGEAIDEIREEFGIDLTDGRHRRNIVTRGVEVHDLLHTTFRVGDALLRGTRPRPPCAHVEQVAGEEGVARALKNRRGGVCADVVEPGTIRAGDELKVVEENPRTMGRKIAERLGL
ncbi:sulfurase [Haloprofundus marisrubri]|uniref:Sulfurase n=1 Tax=Haloprofundus marisrubri TaxID=1514971 RepID=A0A0W1RA59_9EURY|nr:MOSC domain-containing protein [Haloprofundus marisrubri]KTG10409.1 sulfurase [Haloprofundus marisrubri]